MAFFFMAVPAPRSKLFQQPPVALDVPRSPVVGHGKRLVGVVVDETAGEDVTVGTAGTGATVPTIGDTPIVGTEVAGLTPRLPISVDPSGIPARAAPPGVVGDVGVEDEATLLEPAPHIPDNPDVSGIPELVDIPDVADVPDEEDIADGDMAEGIPDPIVVPPPSKVAVDPNIPDGEVPTVEHAVLAPGIAMVPVEEPGSGLIPGDASSVDPSGIPVGETEPPALIPSGEVASREGVVGSVPTCANAGLHSMDNATAMIKERFMRDPQYEPDDYAARRSGGAMNSGPTGSLTVSFRIRSISVIAALSMRQPTTPAIGAS
jgi:hypothetical protein